MTRIAFLTKAGRAEVIRQANELSGKKWDSYEEEFGKLESRASELSQEDLARYGAECEINSYYTLSKLPEFISLSAEHFEFEENDE